MPARAIYLDHHATTPCDPRVVERMLPYFGEVFGNPAAIASQHGREAGQAVEDARARVAELLGVSPDEIVFTSGATESNNLALGSLQQGDHVVSTLLEHRSVLEPLEALQTRGIDVDLITPGADGIVRVEDVEQSIRPETKLVSVISASGEIGTIQPVEGIASLCDSRGISFHTDATQALGRIRFRKPAAGAALLSGSAHKFYGPKGVGFLVARRGVRLMPISRGGGQERGLRSGTLNVPGIIGLVAAIELRDREQDEEAQRLISLREWTIEHLFTAIPSIRVHGDRTRRLPGNISLSVPEIDADSIIHAMKRFSLSAGSACSARQKSPSATLLSLGLSASQSMEVFRIGMGRSTSQDDMGLFVADLREVVEMLR